ncbi:hypothetical protein PVAND_013895 [Polypedilum vanderplanki]|uniref:Uncharacterized protein n=1 Tax=Polypedilum vanderplanki TaxID=319348 RepID=A0A9J6CSP0_POLVA|nr:hypothetical protein PVAND_013895 [Polypedilum vanderplanki]
MCLIKKFLIFSFLIITCESKLYEGKCPKIHLNVSISCDIFIQNEDLHIVGTVEMPSTTLNFFHNPFKSINCMRFALYCGNNIDHALRFIFSCHFDERNHFCFPIRFLQTNENGLYDLEFDFLPGSQCEKSIIKNEVFLLYNDAFNQMILYGCWEVDENQSEQGIWFLSSDEQITKNNIDEFKKLMRNVLNNINLKLVDDMVFYTEDNTACRCESCKYFIDCDISKEKSGDSTYTQHYLFSYIILIRIFISCYGLSFFEV